MIGIVHDAALMLLLNNLSSTALVMVCWWLSHQNATNTDPYARTISAGYGLIGMNVLATMLFRNLPAYADLVALSIVLTKCAFVMTLGFVASRLHIMARRR